MYRRVVERVAFLAFRLSPISSVVTTAGKWTRLWR